MQKMHFNEVILTSNDAAKKRMVPKGTARVHIDGAEFDAVNIPMHGAKKYRVQ